MSTPNDPRRTPAESAPPPSLREAVEGAIDPQHHSDCPVHLPASVVDRILTAIAPFVQELAAARKDSERLDWLEDTLCYAMVCLNGRSMESLPNTGHGWHNGQLRAAIDAARTERTQGGGK